MQLKSIEMFGFKSFPERTVLAFDRGVTAILGPNGCGKSNIVDAVKWVLGEKSAKNLRGGEMLDVIFSGCASRAASGIAQVTLNFDNSDHSLKTPYEEVAIRRRLNRARESEYFINNTPCRLKDIRTLFLNSGVGNSAYSVIEQGRIEELLSARPAERRVIFEEAAEISLFKSQRRETLARLERTEQILARVDDRLAEKERLLRRVSGQAAAARRHRKLANERDTLRAGFYARQRAGLTGGLENVRVRREVLKTELDGAENVLAGINLKFAELSGREGELAAGHNSLARAAGENQEALAGNQLAQANARNRLEALANDLARGEERRSELAARLERLTAQEGEIASEMPEVGERVRAIERDLGEREAFRREWLRRAQAAEAGVTELRNRLIDLNRRRHELAGEAAGREASERSRAARAEEMEARLSRLGRERDEAVRTAEAAAAEYRLAAGKFAEAAERKEALAARSRETAAEVERLLAEERAGEAEKAGLASRKSTLEDLERSLAGSYEGVRNILLAARRGEAAGRGALGRVGDLIRVPENLATALETILGSSVQDIVTETARDAQAAIEYLKRNRLGRATFLPLDRIQPRKRLLPGLDRLPGAIGEAVNLVEFDPRFAAAMEHLLAGILVVDNLDLARELSGREARGVKIVTLDGEVISPSGAMTGGIGKSPPQAGLLRRKAELEALGRELAERGGRLEATTRRREELSAALRTMAEGIADLERKMGEAGRSEAGLKQRLAASLGERDRLERESSEAGAEFQALSRGGDGQREELEGIRRELIGVEAGMAELEGEIGAGIGEQRNSREVLDSLGGEFAELSGKRSEALARLRELESRRRELAEEIAGCRGELKRPELFGEGAEGEINRLRGRLAELMGEEEALVKIRDECRAAGAEIIEQSDILRAEQERLRQAEREGQTQATRLREGLALLDRQEAEIGLRLDHVLAKAREELNLQPEELAALDGRGAEPAANAGAAAGSPLDALSDAELQARIDELSQKIRALGHINPEAIDELAELEAGIEFLRVQKEEEEEAVKTIRQAIERLNADSSARFQATFAAVRGNFQQIFANLFGGGRADLTLEEPAGPEADPLEAGIEIRAQPPGKEPKSISLLSGGEKALCAVALLLALFRAKPSPFCVLDEVDGPLDEANIERFMRQIRAFASDTQFIIITHSQLTMGMTDAIWGVTQRIAGISNVHSLKYAEMERMSRGIPLDPESPIEESGGGREAYEQDELAGAGESPDSGKRLALA
ncbi:MAG: chromosome segregation protein SMC [Planctomycetota bacterium]|jgi:chromosome segregation protein|nr:chromosome segregation protein SMC [Planctomycetota bacterium]